LEKAIKNYTLALEIYSPTFMPQEWGNVHDLLGTMFFNDRKVGTVAANQAAGVEHLNRALEAFMEFPEKWSGVRIKLGQAYAFCTEGDLRTNRSISAQHLTAIVESSMGPSWRQLLQWCGRHERGRW
jgi:hypothetical protein